MRPWLGWIALLLALVATSPASARADSVFMKDGRTIEGKIVEETADEVKIRIGGASKVTTLKKGDVDHVVRQASAADPADTRFEALTPAKPAAYLEAGEWCLAQGRFRDTGIKLLGLAGRLDKTLYVRANLRLADYFLAEAKDKVRAGQFYRRVLRADPGNEAAQAKLNEVKDALGTVRKEATNSLFLGLQAFPTNDWSKILENLQKAKESPYVDRLPADLGVTLADLIKYAIGKQGCKACNSTGGVRCPDCQGTGQIVCPVCKGSGMQPVAPGAKAPTDFAHGYCRTCIGLAYLTCRKCGSVMVLTFPDPKNPGKTKEFVIKTGQEAAVLGPGGMFYPLIAAGQRQTGTPRGGQLICNVCKGKPPKPTPLEINAEKMQLLLRFLQRRVTGEATSEEQFGTKMRRVGVYEYDPEVLADDKLVYTKGAWCTPAQKRGGAVEASEADGEVPVLEKGARKFQPQAGDVADFEQAPKTLSTAVVGEGGAAPETPAAAAESGRLRVTVFTPAASGSPLPPCTVAVDTASRALTLVIFEVPGTQVVWRTELADLEGHPLTLPDGVDPAALTGGQAELRLYYVATNHEAHLTRDGSVDRLSDLYAVLPYRAELREKGGGKVLAAWR